MPGARTSSPAAEAADASPASYVTNAATSLPPAAPRRPLVASAAACQASSGTTLIVGT
jgi:hypothetical protein